MTSRGRLGLRVRPKSQRRHANSGRTPFDCLAWRGGNFESGHFSAAPLGCDIVRSAEAVLDAAAQHEQASVLASIKRIGNRRARLPAETVWLVVVAGAEAIARFGVELRLGRDHRGTPLCVFYRMD